MKIEIEVRNFDELDEALATGHVDRIMLDNFTPEIRRRLSTLWLDDVNWSHRAALHSTRSVTMANAESTISLSEL